MEKTTQKSIDKRTFAIKQIFNLNRDLCKFFLKAIEKEIFLTNGESSNFSRTEIMILILLRKKTYKSTDLAKEIGISASTLTGVVDRLVKKGYIERRNDTKDRRIVLLCASTKLKEDAKIAHNKLVDEIINSNESLEDEWWDDLGFKLSIFEQVIKERLGEFKE